MQAYLDATRKAISKERFESYRRSGDRDDFDVLARYMWNAMVCEAIYPAMHAFEITLRNSLYYAVESAYPAAESDCEDVTSWLDLKRPIIHPNEIRRIPDAKSELARQNKDLTVGRLVAELNLNFWRKLLHKPYGEKSTQAPGNFWPRLLPMAFPHVDRKSNNVSRISETVDEIYKMRNRMFHQEPIFDKVLIKHGKLLRAIGWIAPEMEATVREFDRFPETFTLQPEGLRDRLEQVAKSQHDVRAWSLGRENLVRRAKSILGASHDPGDNNARDLRDLARALLDLSRQPVPPRWVLRAMRERLVAYAAAAPRDATLGSAATALANAIDAQLALEGLSAVIDPAKASPE
jgi:hypothetical protein